MPNHASISYYRMYDASYDEHSDKLLSTYFETFYHIQIRKVFSRVQQKMMAEKNSRTVLVLRTMTAKINLEKKIGFRMSKVSFASNPLIKIIVLKLVAID